MITVDVKGFDKVQRILEALPREIEAKVIGPALNKTAQKARAEINRLVVAEYAVKASDVRNSVDLSPARKGRLTAVITVFGSPSRRGRSMNMIRFLAVQRIANKMKRVRGKKVSKAEIAALNRQLGFLIRRGGGLKTIPGAFVGNNGRTVFRRVGKARLPIEPVQVIGFSQMVNSRKIITKVLEKIETEIPVEVMRAWRRITG